MLKNRFVSLCLSAVVVAGLLFPTFSYSTQSSFLLPLERSAWHGTGNIKFLDKTAISHQRFLEWQPLERASYLKCINIPANWESFHDLEITLSSNQITNSWINIILGDKKNTLSTTYIEIDFIGKKTFQLSFKGQFPSFCKSNAINWKQLAFFALESHSIAKLNIEKLVLTIEEIKIKKADPAPPSSTILLTLQQNQSLFFLPDFYEILGSSSESIIQKLLQNIASMSQNAMLSKEMNPENLFYRTLQCKLNRLSFDKTLMNQYSQLFQKQYWEHLLQQNDILIQENGLFFLLTYDLIRNDILSQPSIDNQFASMLQYMADLEYNQCNYWINTYPFGHGNNHVTRAASFLAILAYYHRNPTQRNSYYQYALQVLDYFFAFQIDKEGVLNEGTHYYVYLMEVLSYYGYFEWNAHHRNIFKDFSFSPKIKAMLDWVYALRMPNGFLPAIDDAWQTKVIFPPRLIIPLLDDKIQANQTSKCWDITNCLDNYSWNIEKPLYIPLFLFGAGETYETAEPYELASRIFTQENQVIFRKDWSPESSYLLFTGKRSSSLHEHDDTGQIQLFSQLNPIILESGYGPEGWSSKQRAYYVSGKAHNTVLIDSQGPKANYDGSIGPVDRSTLKESIINQAIQYAVMDIRRDSLFSDSYWERSVFYIPETESSPYYCIVMDKLSSAQEHVYECIFHPNGSKVYQKDNILRYKKTLPNEIGSIQTTFQALIPKKTDIKKGFYSPYWGQEMITSYISYAEQSKQATFATLIFSKTERDSLSVTPIQSYVKLKSNIDEFAFDIMLNNQTYQDMLLRNPFQTVVQGNWIGSNGTTSYIRKNSNSQELESYISIKASFLNYQQKPLFYSQKRMDSLYFTETNNLYDYYLEYESTELSNVIYLNLFDISKILLDNNEIKFNSFSGGVSINIPPGKHSIILLKKGDS